MTNQGRRRAGDRARSAASKGAAPRTAASAGAVSSSTPDRRGGGRRYAAGRNGGKKNGKGRRKGWRRFVSWKAFGLYALGMMLLGVAGISIAYAMTDIPEANAFARSEATIVYWNDGETELGRFSAENRETVDISDIPQACQDAVVAAEDRSFYDNNGFDPVGMLRAGIGYIQNNGSTAAGGGSTITQQYVKNYYLTQDQTLTRKVQELFISVKIDQQLDKDDILASYLNTIWFGRGGVYGIQTASRSYFGVPVSELDTAQCAALAGILRSPTRYDPTLGPENAERYQQRFAYVVDGMVDIGTLDAATAETLVPPEVVPEQKTNRYGGPNGYLLQQVRDELIDNGFTEEEIDTGGLRVVTTFDPQAQSAAIQSVEAERPQEHADGVRVGLAAVTPGDGAVVAMYGGPDAVEQPFNDALDASVQGGSTVKPFTLAAALEQGISLESRYSGNTLTDPILGPPVHNQDDKEYGEAIDLVTATENSMNTAFVDLAMNIGPDSIVDAQLASGLSYAADEETQLRQDPRVTIGIGHVRPIDMAEAYATLAAGGRHADWYTVRSVTEPGGNVPYRVEPVPESVLDPGVVADTTFALSQVVQNGSGREAQNLNRPAAGKTGTHEDLTAWFSGYVPQLSASVVIFRGEGETAGTVSLDGVDGMDTFTGGAFPARIWTAFMAGALDGMEIQEFPEPAEVGDAVNPSPTPTPTPTETPDEDENGDNGDDNGNGNENGGGNGGDESGSDESGDTGGDTSGDTGGDTSGDTGGDESGSEWSGTDGGSGGDTGGTPTEEPTDEPTGGNGNANGGAWGDGGADR
ncbi:transglycosylase domain-containing protein [Jiangella sp. DSM 45060]|uniref:transglycosylase domain-containing protein n=1 Tax=Jiangella sp. DSM 45060 TaxID=1798224 RepID=UPI00087D3C61|nr:transglycosylase domain-containing protein [Jiangella sp. DSM 45060]SDT68467.1 Membrane carboxypeptidase (penicillin-binding protein) [Jiangella sp. DSM 45060]